VFFSFVCLHLITAHTPPAYTTLSLHDALPICIRSARRSMFCAATALEALARILSAWAVSVDAFFSAFWRSRLRRFSSSSRWRRRSEEHTSELQSRFDLVCRLLLEKKK